VTATVVLFVLVAFVPDPLQRIDDAFLRLMLDVRSDPLTGVAKVFNVLGLVSVMLPVRIAIAGYLAVRRRWWHLAAFVAAVVISEACIGPVKALYDRPRPAMPLVTTSSSSFPSGHAVAAASTLVAAVIALFSLVRAVSRVYLAAHWLTDSVGGVLIGTSAALVTAVGVHLARERQRTGRWATTLSVQGSSEG
jgi:undecaprenyl-diphosphatase